MNVSNSAEIAVTSAKGELINSATDSFSADEIKKEKKKEVERLSFFDGLRGLCSFWILISHAILLTGANLNHLTSRGLAVDFFMILSGFFMAFQFRKKEHHEKLESTNTWLSFYVKRFFRMAPLYYVVLIPVYLFHYPLEQIRNVVYSTMPPPHWSKEVLLEHMKSQVPDWQNILSHVTFVFGAIPRYVESNATTDWSVSIQMQFYLVFPLLMLLIRKVSFAWAGAFLVGTWLVFNKLFGVYYGNSGILPITYNLPAFLPLKIGIFYAGILLAEAFFERKMNPKKTFLLIVMFLGIIAMRKDLRMVAFCSLVLFLMFYEVENDFFKIKPLFSLVNSFFNSSVIKFMGQCSYGVYLVHMVILKLIAAYLAQSPLFLAQSDWVRFLVLLGAGLIPIYVTSYLAYNYIEKPGISLGQAFLKNFVKK